MTAGFWLALLTWPCSLTCRTFDSGLAEVCHQEGIALLAYSPLAMGLLTVRLRICIERRVLQASSFPVPILRSPCKIVPAVAAGQVPGRSWAA